MNYTILICTASLLAVSTGAQTNAPAATTNSPTQPGTISIQEMLVIGPPQLKLHSLAMITQGKVKGDIDESYLPGLKVCAEDSDDLVRNITAKLLGQHFIEGKEIPNPEVVALLTKLATDKTSFVRYNAAYYGLAALKEKSPEVITLLIEAAVTDRDKLLGERIAESLKDQREETAKILDEKLKADTPIAYFEIYEKLTGRKPAAEDRFMEMPSSLPVLFVFTGMGDESGTFKTDLEAELKAIGLTNPELSTTGTGNSYAVILKTYITRDRVAVEKAFASHAEFPTPQVWWLTPELEVQFEQMRNK